MKISLVPETPVHLTTECLNMDLEIESLLDNNSDLDILSNKLIKKLLRDKDLID